MNARIPSAFPALSTAQSIGHIAVQWPGATAIFRRLKLDFCCGRQVSLRASTARKGLDTEAVLNKLETLQRSDMLPGAAETMAQAH